MNFLGFQISLLILHSKERSSSAEAQTSVKGRKVFLSTEGTRKLGILDGSLNVLRCTCRSLFHTQVMGWILPPWWGRGDLTHTSCLCPFHLLFLWQLNPVSGAIDATCFLLCVTLNQNVFDCRIRWSPVEMRQFSGKGTTSFRGNGFLKIMITIDTLKC